jgi:hypothetical protein
LNLERLETRACPTGPTISVLATVLSNHRVLLTGTVTDDQPASVRVSFSGVASGSTTADSSGKFSATLTASGIGTVSAVGVDGQDLTSNTAQAAVDPAAPALTLSLTYGSQKTVTLSGQVNDVDVGGRTVTFSGVVSGSAVTGADGTFSYTAQASRLGNVQATTTDLWGLTSNTAQVAVAVAAPVITSFSMVQEANGWWHLSGTVNYPNPAGLTVNFGGVAALAGKTAPVQADGSFAADFPLGTTFSGTASAQTTDWWGQASNTFLFTC